MVLILVSPHHPFPCELRFLEVQQQSHFQSGDVQVAEHLCDVGVGKCAHHFWIGDYLAVNDEIGHQLADELAPVVNRMFALLFHRVPSGDEFDDQRILVKLFIQTGLVFVEHSHRRAARRGSLADEHRIEAAQFAVERNRLRARRRPPTR